MPRNEEAIKILKRWIDHCVNRGMMKKAKDFFLLWDYAEGDHTDEFYNANKSEKDKILASLDSSKEEVKMLKSMLI